MTAVNIHCRYGACQDFLVSTGTPVSERENYLGCLLRCNMIYPQDINLSPPHSLNFKSNDVTNTGIKIKNSVYPES